MFSTGEIERYGRHLVLKGFGAPGQQKLKNARVLVVGAGGLGSPVIAYLAAAGTGRITIVDDDGVCLSNLQRQIVHDSAGLGQNKAESAAEFARALNPEILLEPLDLRLDEHNGCEIIRDHDVVVDGTDLFSSRAMIARLCEAAEITLVSGAVSMFDGQVSVFAPHLKDHEGRPAPRFSCLYPQTPDDGELPACETAGILGATTGVIGTLMAMETIKVISGVGEPLIGRLLLYDGRTARFTELNYQRSD